MRSGIVALTLLGALFPAETALSADFVGTPERDLIFGTEAGDLIDGRGGADRIFGKQGNDELYGGPHGDVLFLGAGADVANGRHGRDFFIVDDDGAPGDTLIGGPEAVRDVLSSIDGAPDVLRCGAGVDIAYVDTVDEVHSCERQLARTGQIDPFGNRVVVGTNAGDVLRGDDRDEYLYGKRGADRLLGGKGNDIIFGGSGRDVLAGEDDDDELIDDDGTPGDALIGGSHDDFLVSADGADHDTVRCGDGRDRAVVDPKDDVSADCELVTRSLPGVA